MIEAAPALWVLLAVLLLLSGTFSASETALFSLTLEQRLHAPKHVGRLLQRPSDTLVTILLGNLVVNVLFFAFATRVRVPAIDALDVAVLQSVPPLVTLLVAGEILPKTLALRAPMGVAHAVALPLEVASVVLSPVRRLVQVALSAATRLLNPAAHDESELTSEVLEELLSRSAAEGHIAEDEVDMISEIVELAGIRVREIMRPRVDMLTIDESEPDPGAVAREALERHANWLPVVRGNADEVVGCVRVRDLLREPGKPVRELVMPVKFVPEVATALSLLLELQRDRATEAVVVDEWGGTAGVVTIEDVFEEIVGELRVEGEAREKPVVPLGEGRYRVAGHLPVRDWNERFGHRIVPTEFETVGGLVTALLGRIPRTGDRVRLGNLVFEVREVRGRRVLSVDVFLEPAGGPA